MRQHPLQMRVSSMLALVACIAVNFWLFRLGALWGILGLNVSKHVVIAALCQWLGVDHNRSSSPSTSPPAPQPVTLEP
jgi:hypothetical protein